MEKLSKIGKEILSEFANIKIHKLSSPYKGVPQHSKKRKRFFCLFFFFFFLVPQRFFFFFLSFFLLFYRSLLCDVATPSNKIILFLVFLGFPSLVMLNQKKKNTQTLWWRRYDGVTRNRKKIQKQKKKDLKVWYPLVSLFHTSLLNPTKRKKNERLFSVFRTSYFVFKKEPLLVESKNE